MKISHFAVKHPVVIAMIVISLVAFGIYCVVGTSLEFLPDISMPEVEVITIYPGATAEEVEQDVTRILEDEFATLPNYKSMESTNMNSVSWISITYRDGIDPYDQLTDLRYRIDSLADELPADAEKPMSLVGGATMLPIMEFAIMGGTDTARILDYIENTLKPKLTRIEGVSEISVYGASDMEIQVRLRMADLQSRGVSVVQVYQVLSYSNFSMPLGSADFHGQSINIKYDGSILDIEELKRLPVGAGDGNVVIRLEDVADVYYGYAEPVNYVLSEGSNMALVSVRKRGSGNTVRINRQIKQVLAGLAEDTDGALSYRIFADDSKSIKSSLVNVLESGIAGVIIAVIVIFLFLNDPRSTLVIGASIPLSVLFTFIAMRLIGSTINLMTTASFVVALGMIVDGSTVMLEQISRYLGKPGFSTEQAILRGSDEVGASITASVLTTVVVFLPICFLTGIVGMILNGFAVVLVFCMLASLIVSVVVVPWLMKVFIGEKWKQPKTTWFMRGADRLETAYRKGLSWSLNHRTYVIVLPILLLLLSLGLVSGLGYSFIPSVDTGEIYAMIDFPSGYDMDRTREKMVEAGEVIKELVPENDGIAVYVGVNSIMSSMFGVSQPQSGYVYIMLKERGSGINSIFTGASYGGSKTQRRDVHEIILMLQDELSSRIPDAKVTVSNGGLDRLVGYISDGGGFSIKLVGSDLTELYAAASEIRNVLEQDPEVVQTGIDTNFDEVLLSLKMDQEKLSSMGITSYEAGMISTILFNGVDVGNLTDPAGDRHNIHLSSDIADGRLDMNMLNRMDIKTLAGSTVSFTDLGTLEVGNTVSSINHSERTKCITVSAVLVSEDASGVNSRMSSWLAENPLPSGINTESAGVMGLIEDSLGSMVSALVIAVFLVFAVMVIQFERFKQPFVIILSVPFCLVGVIVSLLAFGSSITLMSAVALIALMGIVVNNAIILVDYINQIRDRKRAALILGVPEELVDAPESRYTQEEGRGKLLDFETEREILTSSIAEGGSSRLRPILMTTLTTLVGMLPMAFAVGEGSELYASVGQSIAGGLFASTLITLFIVPVMYYIFENRELEKHLRRGRIQRNIINARYTETEAGR